MSCTSVPVCGSTDFCILLDVCCAFCSVHRHLSFIWEEFEPLTLQIASPLWSMVFFFCESFENCLISFLYFPLSSLFFRPISQFILFSNFCLMHMLIFFISTIYFSKLPSTFLVSYCLLIFESVISLFKRGHSLSDNRYSWSYWGSKLVAFLFLAESHSWFFLFPLVIVDLWKFIFGYFNLRKNCGLNWGHFFLRRIYTFPSTMRQIEPFGGPWMNPRVSSSAGPPHFWPTAGSPEPVDGITDNRNCSILTTTPLPLLFVDSPSFQWVQKCKGHFLFSLKKPFILISLLAGNHRS